MDEESLFYIQEKEIKELKKKLGEIEDRCKWEVGAPKDESKLTEYGLGYRRANENILSDFFPSKSTPEQTEANEIIKNTSPEVLEELKKLL